MNLKGNSTTSKSMSLVRTEDWELVHFMEDPWGQQFDLFADQVEAENLRDSSQQIAQKQVLFAGCYANGGAVTATRMQPAGRNTPKACQSQFSLPKRGS